MIKMSGIGSFMLLATISEFIIFCVRHAKHFHK